MRIVCSHKELLHHRVELVEVYFSVAVHVNFFDEVKPDLIVYLFASPKDVLDFFSTYRSITVAIKDFEGLLKLLLR